jgi:pentapeptide MXKDX repeat protein
MKSVLTVLVLGSAFAVGVCVLPGCNSGSGAQNKMSGEKTGMEDKMMSDKMTGEKMSTDKMSGDKMTNDKMTGDKMGTGK